MRIPITQVHRGMVVINANGHRLEVMDRDSWCPASGGRPWVHLTLRCMASGALSQAGYRPDVQVDVDSTIPPDDVKPPSPNPKAT